MTTLTGVYAVTVPPSVSDDPIRWLFADEADADAFAQAINGERNHLFLRDSELPEAVVSYEPIATSLHDPHLREAYPEETETALAILGPEG
jgi:hypothetical protein